MLISRGGILYGTIVYPSQGRGHAGITFLEVLAAAAVISVLSGLAITAVGYWTAARDKSGNIAQVPFIDQALRNYAGTYSILPDLNDSTDVSRWLLLYTPPGSATLPDGQPRTLPDGITYQVVSDYQPPTLDQSQQAGKVTLGGTPCDLTSQQTTCTLRIVP